MTKPIQLHVGYVGITREGKRVEIIGYLPDYTPYPWESDLEAYTSDGLYMNNNTSHLDIIGPWAETPVEPPVDYNDGKWHRWAGGECPVHLSSVVEIKFINGCANEIQGGSNGAGNFAWVSISHPIISFRVTKVYVEPHKVPREFWVRFGTAYNMPIESDAIHVREVLTDD
jgi:hypothetical protein